MKIPIQEAVFGAVHDAVDGAVDEAVFGAMHRAVPQDVYWAVDLDAAMHVCEPVRVEALDLLRSMR